jgi:glycosyltransferase involved in cell wall biosynthesis
MSKILVLATAGLKPDQKNDVDHRLYPRVDYLELKHLLNIDVINYSIYDRTRMGGIFRSLETQIHSDLYLTWLGWRARHHYDLVFTMSERAGIPFAGLRQLESLSQSFVTMFQSWSWRQEAVIKNLRLFKTMSHIAVHCQSMKCHLNSLGAPLEDLVVLPYSVDHHFFRPLRDVNQEPGLIMSVGEIRSRDYATLMTAIEGLSVHLVVAASGSWYAREKNTHLNTRIPDNTTITGHKSSIELRQLYAQSQFVVLPVYDTVFSAGSTVVMEAACMGRAVIATRSQGITDYVIDGVTGILVEPNDPMALREAICYLLDHPEEAHRLGRNARQRVEEEYNLDIYVECMAQQLQRYL